MNNPNILDWNLPTKIPTDKSYIITQHLDGTYTQDYISMDEVFDTWAEDVIRWAYCPLHDMTEFDTEVDIIELINASWRSYVGTKNVTIDYINGWNNCLSHLYNKIQERYADQEISHNDNSSKHVNPPKDDFMPEPKDDSDDSREWYCDGDDKSHARDHSYEDFIKREKEIVDRHEHDKLDSLRDRMERKAGYGEDSSKPRSICDSPFYKYIQLRDEEIRRMGIIPDMETYSEHEEAVKRVIEKHPEYRDIARDDGEFIKGVTYF